MNDQDVTIPAATTPGEINTHLGYLRRDILNLSKETSKRLDEITKQIQTLDDHYISESEFRPTADLAKTTALEMKSLTEWKDTFNGKMIGLGIGISVATSAITFILTYFIKK